MTKTNGDTSGIGFPVNALSPSDILFNIVSGNGLAPVQCQVITWINTDLSVGLQRTNISEIFITIYNFFLEEMFQFAVSKMVAILLQPQCVSMWGVINQLTFSKSFGTDVIIPGIEPLHKPMLTFYQQAPQEHIQM